MYDEQPMVNQISGTTLNNYLTEVLEGKAISSRADYNWDDYSMLLWLVIIGDVAVQVIAWSLPIIILLVMYEIRI